MRRLGLMGGGPAPAGYVPPMSAYLASYALMGCLTLVALFIFVTAHTTIGLALARSFGPEPSRDVRYWAYVLFWLGNVLTGVVLVGLCGYATSALRAAVESGRLVRSFVRMGSVFAFLALAVLAAELAVLR